MTEKELAELSAELKIDRDRYKQLYEQALARLKQEQADHAKTKVNLLKILGDTIAVSKPS